MAFNWQTFKTRTLTAVVFAGVMLGGLLVNQWTFFILFSIIHFGCWLEYQKLVVIIDKKYQQITVFHKYGVMIAGWCIMLFFANDTYRIAGFNLHEIGLWGGSIFFFILLLNELIFFKNFHLKNIGYSVFGLIYISFSWGLMIKLYHQVDITIHDIEYILRDYFIPIAIIASIWINDTMAYIVGSLIGKNSLSKISPKKTWEGTIGGIILSIILVWLISFYSFHFGSLTYRFVIIAGTSSIAGTFGDLFESKLKRLANVKDSGKIMPGHGGFLDRFDSLLLAIPAVWLYLDFFIQ